jgi:hypothetical protein
MASDQAYLLAKLHENQEKQARRAPRAGQKSCQQNQSSASANAVLDEGLVAVTFNLWKEQQHVLQK